MSEAWPHLWLNRRLRLPPEARPGPEELRAYQLDLLRMTLANVSQSSPFYRGRIGSVLSKHGLPEALADLAALPRTTADDLRRDPHAFLCVSQDEVARAVSLQSSGTTGPGKRVFFTAGDLERTVDFFAHGMLGLMGCGETALILLPGDRPDSVGRLLAQALDRFGGKGLIHGPLGRDSGDPATALETILEQDVSCLVGCPAHLNTLATHWRERGLGPGRVRSILACWDVLPGSLLRNLRGIFGCRCLTHWGMIETCLGGGVECREDSGAHLREPDIYVEIADPDTGRTLPDGEWGEILVTTLSRRAMPLIRYRTGDLGRILPGVCVCNSPLRRLDRVPGRLDENQLLAEMGETLYALPGLADFRAERAGERLLLRISAAGNIAGVRRAAVRAMERIGEEYALKVEIQDAGPGPAEPGLAKRRVHEAAEQKEQA
ncbi:MAG: AMP-binding protein [Desulfovibrionaceae bacterium]